MAQMPASNHETDGRQHDDARRIRADRCDSDEVSRMWTRLFSTNAGARATRAARPHMDRRRVGIDSVGNVGLELKCCSGGKALIEQSGWPRDAELFIARVQSHHMARLSGTPYFGVLDISHFATTDVGRSGRPAPVHFTGPLRGRWSLRMTKTLWGVHTSFACCR
jgi:hypothetical protein